MAQPTKERSRIWNMILYPDDPQHMAAIEHIRKEFQYVGILHGSDTWTEDDEQNNPEHKSGMLKKPHMHFVIRFTQARWNTSLSEVLGVPVNYMERCRSFDNSAVYLLHEGCDNKYQYDVSELEGPLIPSVIKLLENACEDERVKKLVKMIASMDYIEYEDLVILACDNGLYSDLRRMGFILSKIVDNHNLRVRGGVDY